MIAHRRYSRVLFAVAVVVAFLTHAQVGLAAKGFVSISPADGATVTTTRPSFSIQTQGFSPTLSDDNFWLAVSSSFQVNYDGTLTDTFGCLFSARPVSSTSAEYVADSPLRHHSSRCPLLLRAGVHHGRKSVAC